MIFEIIMGILSVIAIYDYIRINKECDRLTEENRNLEQKIKELLEKQ